MLRHVSTLDTHTHTHTHTQSSNTNTIVYTATSKNYFTNQRLKNCIYYIHVFYIFYLSNSFMYFTCLIMYNVQVILARNK
jgi:hypothetical protein